MEAKSRLKSIRDKLGLSQAEFGLPLGLSQANIRDLESGKVKFSTLHARAIENVYGVQAEWLLSGKGPQNRPEVVYATSPTADLIAEAHQPYGALPRENQRILQLPELLDLTDDEFCQRLGGNIKDLDHVKAGRPVSELLIRAVAYEFGVRMRWIKMGELPFRNMSGAPDHFAQDMWGLIQQSAQKLKDEGEF